MNEQTKIPEESPVFRETAPDGERTILEYNQVDICFNGNRVVHNVSFSLEKGEILGIVGESGSGKSTLIRAAMGLLGPDGMVTRGDIWYQGKSLPDLSERELRIINGAKISMIFQNAGSSFCPIRTIGSQFYESLRAHEKVTKQEVRERAAGLLEKIGFADPARILDSYPFELSGGMQQRAGIAAAMLSEPEILLADEPTSALDVSVQKQVVEEMLMIRRLYGTAIVIVTHNIGVIRAMADRVIVMKDGEMVEYGDAKQVVEHPSHDYTKRLMDAVPKLKR